MGTRRIRVGCEFVYQAEVDTPALFRVRPAPDPDVSLDDQQWLSEPRMAIRDSADIYGNRGVRVVLPAGRSSFGYRGVVTVPDATEEAGPGPRSARLMTSPTTR